MNAKECRIIRLEIDTAELNERLSDRAAAHVAACASCTEFRAQRVRLRTLLGSFQPVSAPADFDMKLRARIARENDQRAQQSSIFRLLVSTPGIVFAALLVAVVAVAVWVSQRRPREIAGAPRATAVNTNTPAGVTTATTEQHSTEEGAKQTASTAGLSSDTGHKTAPRNQKPVLASTGTARVSDFNARAAELIRLTPDRAGEVSLTAPLHPTVVSVRDANGATRKILLPPVSFGSPRLTDNRVPVSMSNSRDW